MRKKTRSEADLEIVLRALDEANVPLKVQGGAFGVKSATISSWRTRLKFSRPLSPIMVPLDGERWTPIPGYRAQLSNMDRVASSRGALLKPKILYGSEIYRLTNDAGKAEFTRFKTIKYRMGLIPKSALLDADAWTEQEDAALRLASCAKEAQHYIPSRSARSIEKRKMRLGLVWKYNRSWTPPPKRENGAALYRKAMEAVPRGIPQDMRDDLINDIVVLILEGRAKTVPEALKLAKTEHNRLIGAFKERSLDAPLPGFDDLKLIDTLADDVVRF